jgi:amylosucrase
VLANVGDDLALIDPITLGGFAHAAVDVVTGDEVELLHGVALEPHGFVWLRVTPL